MARLEDLIANIESPALRDAIAHEARTLKQRIAFGLVFERHIPENVLLAPSVGLAAGDQVRLRQAPDDPRDLRVLARDDDAATLVDEDGREHAASLDDLLVVRGFGESVYPTLTPVGRVERGGDRPFHTVVNGENYHALQLMVHCWAGQVDCIYADPPYNTGARDWKYNNDYVDGGDAWRHSKWLSMMEKRLQLAKRLLKPDGVLIVTIDENEVHHLGVLLETLFPDALRQMVSICIQPSGAGGEGLSRVEEYAFFCFLGSAQPVSVPDDMLTAGSDPEGEIASDDAEQGLTWESLLRRGNAWYRARRRNLCYPILLNRDATAIVRAGEPWAPPVNRKGVEDESRRPRTIDGHPVAWPVRKDGKLGIWRVDGSRLEWLAERGYAHVAGRDDSRDTWALRYLMSGMVDGIEAGTVELTGRGDRGQVEGIVTTRRGRTAKTIWHRGRHNAGGSGGTQLLTALLGENDLFSFPKSVYAVRDCLQIAVGDRREALVVDFFAGSGTTLHATALLNAEDGGRRRSAIVTNNEVDADRTRQLQAQGAVRGDEAFERHGIFEAVTRPRCTAAISGTRPDGTPAPGRYLDGRPYADGLEENCEFFRLDYLDPGEVELGRAFAAVHPLLWLAAGARRPRDDELGPDQPFVVVPEGAYAVLFDELALRELVAALNAADGIEHVFLVTDSEDAYAEMCESIGAGVTPHMLYRDYLSSFAIHATPPA